MTVRVELTSLTQYGEYYLLNGTPFSGEAYDHRDNRLYQVYVLHEGKVTSEKECGFFNQPGVIRIDYAELESGETVDLPSYYQGKLFTGLVYEYANGYCSKEIFYVDGFEIEHVSWLPDGSGRFRDYSKTTETGEYKIIWRNNQLGRFSTDLYNVGSLSFGFDNELKIARISSIAGDYHLIVPFLPRQDLGLDFSSFDELLARGQIAEKLDLSYIDNETIMLNWLKEGYLTQVTNLLLEQTAISGHGLKQFAKLPNLKNLTVVEKHTVRKSRDPVFAQQQNQRDAELKQALEQIHLASGINVKFIDTN